MVGALWTGISGLNGSQTGLDNESNNIANVNTIGFKASRVSFADQMYQDRIGKGVTSFDVEKMYTQGNLKNTGVSYDLALSGDGFFQVKDGADTFYTRAGNFRMGEGGALEDVSQNKVQGWAIQDKSSGDIVSTDPNATFFTNDFTKLLGNKVIRDTTTIETIATKATDYTSTAETDSKTIFSGAGYKSASTKIGDIESLITEYNAALSVYAEADPKPTSSSSSTQKDFLNFGLNATSLSEGDEIYLYVDGVKYSQSFEADQETTVKKFVDTLSDTVGLKAYLTADPSSPYTLDIPDTDSAGFENGYIVIEGMIPGQQLRVSELGWTDATNSNLASKGTLINVQEGTLGTGMGHITTIEDALAEAISGKQMDVYQPTGSGSMVFDGTTANNNYTYQVEIYDDERKTTISVPDVPLDLNDGNDLANLDMLVARINNEDYPTAGANSLPGYVEAFNINGNLVVKTLDKNNEVEFTGTLVGNMSDITEEQQTVTFNDATGLGDFEISLNGTNYTITTVTATDSASVLAQALITAVGTSDPDIASIEEGATGVVTVIYKEAAGDIDIPAYTAGTATFSTAPATATPVPYDGTTYLSDQILARDPNFSGREGAGAEFLQIKTTINQTASKGDIQLRLDTLGLTDSAFGDFNVDNTGLITMTQDGVKFAIGQVAVAKFTDNRGLEPVGDNLLQETTRSGSALFNINNDKTAEIKGGNLELSTADLSESLVNLMVFQRAFEANAKSITTADQILTTLIQLKR
jgi:flagellar hook protein FlgE